MADILGWDLLLIVLSLISAVVGLLGAVLPALPGPPLSFVGLLLLFFCSNSNVGWVSLCVTAVFAVIITILDYLLPILMAKIKGGSKKGMVGAGIGMFVGLFFSPIGLIAGPFLGAFVGELMAKTPTGSALKVSLMTFAAFMLTTGIKLIYSLVLFVYIVYEVIRLFV
ncbi:MAG: DUF456 domain-containing protein [Bacteroidaceae bacterium]|nr:DUF456 domain-containing protein [Bacteroidaceae bacterium]